MIIYKYVLKITDYQSIVIKGLNEVLSVTTQKETLVLYASVNEINSKNYTIDVAVIGTGNLFRPPYSWNFLGTCSMAGGQLMWHVFYHLR